jgi:hypothetical protein
MSTQSGKFEKFEFWVLAGISSNGGRRKSSEINFTGAALFRLDQML